MVAAKCSGDGKPVDQIARMPDEESGRVIEAGMSEVKIVPDANWTGVRVVAAEDGIAISVLMRSNGEVGPGGKRKGR
jgi:hypothetical protein